VIDGEDRMQRVLQVEPAARAAGVQAGMNLASALALLPTLDARPRDIAREREWLQSLATLGARFTPRVSVESPDGLLLEIKGSVGLFGGLEALCREVTAHYARHGAEVSFAVAPTPLAALVGARVGRAFSVTTLEALPGQLGPLPLGALRWPEEVLRRLGAMGVRTLGEALRLPRAGFAKRFGPALLQALDRLVGRQREVRGAYASRERFYGRFEPAYEITHHEGLLAVLRPLLADLEHFLLHRQRGITQLRCRFRHRQAPPTVCQLGLAAPEANAERLAKLLAERLAQITLPEPVRLCEVRSGALVERPLASRAIWSPGEHGYASASEMPALIEQLRARLGAEAVYGLCLVPEHRPEAAWRVAEPVIGAVRERHRPSAGAAADAAAWSPFGRPLWLLAEPQLLAVDANYWPLYHGPLRSLTGPERIESGWWSGADVARDYYTALDAAGARLWIFRERQAPHAWYLHGVFG
jgi:protein ImuB